MNILTSSKINKLSAVEEHWAWCKRSH